MIIFSSIKLGLNLFFRRKINLLWAIIPFLLGIILYIAFGAWMFSMLKLFSEEILKISLVNKWSSGITFTTISIIVGVAIYFLFNWLFLLCVFFLSYPFHRLIAQNTQKELMVTTSNQNQFSLKELSNEIFKVLLNLFITLIVFACAAFPPTAFLALLGSALLVTIQFIDYPWSQNKLNFKDCLQDLKKNILNYLAMGGIGLFLMAIPLINVMFMPVLVSIFIVLFYKQRGAA
jgi:CysZ protein